MKKALVTGASSGIGKDVVSRLQVAGWEVVELKHDNFDLSKPETIAQDVAKLQKANPHFDALIHVAGVWHTQDKVLADKRLEDFSPDEIVNTINVGLTSFMVLVAKLLPSMSKDGSILAITGTFSDGGAGWLPYYTSKRALEDFLVGLAEDYPNGPKIFGVSPADTATPAYKKFYPEYAAEAQSPAVVAQVCLDLLEDKKAYKSGEIIGVRDGQLSKGYHT